jgi:SAM-dependent methyltransferase
MAFEIIEHLPKEAVQPFVSELHRVLAQDGILILSTPNRANRGFMPDCHTQEFSVSEIQELLKTCRFSILKQSGLFLSLYKNRYSNNKFSSARHAIYTNLHSKQKTTLSGVISWLLKKTLIFLAKLCCYLGYLFPDRAEYQFWVAKKQ